MAFTSYPGLHQPTGLPGPTCQVILNPEYNALVTPDLLRFCGRPATNAMRLPSGRFVAWCCEIHRKVAVA